MLSWIVAFSLLGSVGGITLAAALLLFPGWLQDRIVPILISYSAGTLLGGAFLALIPETLDLISPSATLTTVLAGIVLFFLLEKLLIWRHCHDEHCEVHDVSGSLILAGDAFHNLTDGVVIAASFLTSIPLGIAVSLAVIAHEVPQEVGDFGILLHSGYSRTRAFVYNTLSGLATLGGAVGSYFFLSVLTEYVPYVMAISAASFIYISTADLFPHLHRMPRLTEGIQQLLLILIGIGTIALLELLH
ncbi:MAG: ZIP family metal transporter [Methanomicrobiales archaeon]|nr:ZIP family metal transporter [Methanomicrobiales archaeon]MDI6875909.1 ZIP family metal transporter [Methanomicrobiales archaeon]